MSDVADRFEWSSEKASGQRHSTLLNLISTELAHIARELRTAKIHLRRQVLRQYQEDRDAVVERIRSKKLSGRLNKSEQKLIDNGQAMQDLAERLVEDFLDPFNDIKGDLDKAYRAKDWRTMEAELEKIYELKNTIADDWDRAFQVVARNRKFYRVDSNLQKELIKIRDFVRWTYNGGVKEVIRLKKRDPGQIVKVQEENRLKREEKRRDEEMALLREGRWEKVESSELKIGDIVEWPHSGRRPRSLYELGEIEYDDYAPEGIGQFYKLSPERGRRPTGNRLWSGMEWRRKVR